jgi:serine/threonine protein phosphatase PrpC
VNHYARDNGDPQAALTRAVRLANQAIQRQARAHTALKGMGTTCTALVLRQGWAYCAHVGDSRLYLLRGGDILQLTEDHSAVFNLVKRGVIDREDARVHPDRNVIVRALGSRSEVEVAQWAQPMRVMPNDRFIVSTDGLHDLVTDAEIQAAVRDLPPDEACERLVQAARERGGHDNISVGILSVGGTEPPGNEDGSEPRAAA